jgi:acetyl-CoA synthetase
MLQVLADHGVSNVAAAPTAYRALKSADWAGLGPYRVRCASSAGEPLTPDVNAWALEAFGVEVRDHYGQTEIGMCVGNHQHPELRRPVKEGSMGQALPGWTMAVLRDDADEIAPHDTLGRLAVDVDHSPLMTFRDYHGGSAAADRFVGDGRWYLTGDAARQDADGDIFFAARDDDVIIMAGYRIGPFDVEAVLSQHEAVAECAVIAVPDDARGEVVEAFVVVREPHVAGDALAATLQRFVKERYAAYAYPRLVHFTDALPKTPSGKIQRYVLRAGRRDVEKLRSPPLKG